MFLLTYGVTIRGGLICPGAGAGLISYFGPTRPLMDARHLVLLVARDGKQSSDSTALQGFVAPLFHTPRPAC